MLLGQMQDSPLLVSSLIDYAAQYHGDTEIVSRTIEGPISLTFARSRRAAAITVAIAPGGSRTTAAWTTRGWAGIPNSS